MIPLAPIYCALMAWVTNEQVVLEESTNKYVGSVRRVILVFLGVIQG